MKKYNIINNFYPKKNLGQHFLLNNNLAKKIVESLSLKKDTYIIEVGPGQGALTKYLIKKYKNIFLIEKDKKLFFFLKKKYPNLIHKIINDDFLDWNPELFNITNFGLIGNFPYNISSKILYKLFLFNDNILECIGMFQKEIVNKILSKKNSKLYGILSVILQYFYNIEYLFSVDKKYFYPHTSVESCVVKFIKKKISKKINKILFYNIIKISFSQRRKTLKNNLKYFFSNKLLNNIPLYLLNKRAEEISVNKFIKITYFLQNE